MEIGNMLEKLRKVDCAVGSFEADLELVAMVNVIRLLRNKVLDKYLMDLESDNSNSTYTTHKITLGRKINVAEYETEDFVNEKTLAINNKYSSVLQSVLCNIYHFSMVYDLYTMLNAYGYIDNENYKQKIEAIKKGILAMFNSIKNVDDVHLEEFYIKYKEYIESDILNVAI